MKRVILFGVILTLVHQIKSQQFKICNQTSFYDTSSFSCRTCPNKMEPEIRSDHQTPKTCICKQGYFNSNPSQPGSVPCSPCGSGRVSSLSRVACQQCPAGIDPKTKECICEGPFALIETSAAGVYLDTKICQKCNANTYTGPLDIDLPSYGCK